MSDPKVVTINLSPKSARFLAHACDIMVLSGRAGKELDDELDRELYRALADYIRAASDV